MPPPAHILTLVACGALSVIGCSWEEPITNSLADAASTREAVDASFLQGQPCDETPRAGYEATEPSGSWPIQIGVPKDPLRFTLFGAGCDIPVMGTIQGNQYARFALRFAGPQSPLVYARFTVSSLENVDAGVVRDVGYNVEHLAVCKSDGYCYVTPILANIVDLADKQDELRGHAVSVSVHLSEVNNEEHFGHSVTWGRLRFPDEAPCAAGSSDSGSCRQ